MGFADWSEVNTDPFELPINGTKYCIPPIGYLDELRIREAQKAQAELSDLRAETPPNAAKIAAAEKRLMSDEDFLHACLGDQLAAMRANNVPGMAIVHAAATAHVAHTQGRDVAEIVWTRGLDPKALTEDLLAIQKQIQQGTV